jgi:DNA-binding MarR family transcriptional regulator
VNQVVLEKEIGYIIYRTALAVRSALQRTLKERGFDVTPEQCGILRVLQEKEGLSQKEIGNLVFKDKPNITRMLDALEGKGLIRRHRSDRRQYAVFLTETGKALMAEIQPILLQMRQKTVEGLLSREIATLEATLDKIYKNIA